MSRVISHQHILDKLLSYAGQGTMSGSWIFSGIKGTGKALVAGLLAEKLLKGNTSNLKIIERDLTDAEKKELLKLIEDGKELNPDKEAKRERKSEITVDNIRSMEDFTALRSIDDTPKIVIIDSVDDLNTNAANALLKTLEEPPPNTIIILISHQIQKLLATIKSRCKVVKFMPISEDELRNHIVDMFGSFKDIEIVIKLSEGSIGKAYELIANGGAGLYNDIIDGFVLGAVPKSVNKENINLAFEMVFVGLSRLVKHIEGANDTVPAEAMAFDCLKYSSYKVMELRNQVIEKFNQSKFLYLDKMTVLENIFFKLKRLK